MGLAVKCPYCHENNDEVSNSRRTRFHIWRRRVCKSCRRPFTTHERVREFTLNKRVRAAREWMNAPDGIVRMRRDVVK